MVGLCWFPSFPNEPSDLGLFVDRPSGEEVEDALHRIHRLHAAFLARRGRRTSVDGGAAGMWDVTSNVSSWAYKPTNRSG